MTVQLIIFNQLKFTWEKAKLKLKNIKESLLAHQNPSIR